MINDYGEIYNYIFEFVENCFDDEERLDWLRECKNHPNYVSSNYNPKIVKEVCEELIEAVKEDM